MARIDPEKEKKQRKDFLKQASEMLHETKKQLLKELQGRVKEETEGLKDEGRDFLLVTHEMGFARQVADRVAFLSTGRILEHAPAEELFAEPRTAECRDFLARILKY